MIPADERLAAGNRVGFEPQLRLQIDLELVFFDGFAQLAGEFLLGAVAATEEVGVKDDLTAAAVLGGIKRLIGLLDERLARDGVGAGHRGADGNADMDGLFVPVERHGNVAQHQFGAGHQRVLGGDAGADQQEFIAAGATDEIVGPGVAREPRRDMAQGGVARRMAERVVDLLELVEVDLQHADLAVADILQHRVGAHIGGEPFAVGEPVRSS